MNHLLDALQGLIELFERLRIPYALMGGLAVRVYGIPRATYDLDFTVAVARPQLPELFRAAEELGYSVPEPSTAGWLDEVAGMPLVKLRLFLEGHGIDVDVFLAESPYQHTLLARRRREIIDEVAAWLVSPEDLILLKLLAHRPRDIADVGDVLFVQGQLDEPYLREWAKYLGVLDLLERMLSASSGP